MTQIRITDISGSTAYPFSVYISDVYGNYQTLIGTISSAVPPTVYYNTVIPAIFETAPQIMLTLFDSNNCSIFKILDCTFGCTFQITIEIANCIVDINIQNSSCSFGVTTDESTCFVNELV
jgi:hypothetical protein